MPKDNSARLDVRDVRDVRDERRKRQEAARQVAEDPELQKLAVHADETGDVKPLCGYVVDRTLEDVKTFDTNDGKVVKDKKLIAALEDCQENDLIILNTVMDVIVDRWFGVMTASMAADGGNPALDTFRPDDAAVMTATVIEKTLKRAVASSIDRKVAEYTPVYEKRIARDRANGKRPDALARPSDTASMLSTTSTATSVAMSDALESVARSMSKTRLATNRRGKGLFRANDERNADMPQDGEKPARRDERDRRDRDRPSYDRGQLPRR